LWQAMFQPSSLSLRLTVGHPISIFCRCRPRNCSVCCSIFLDLHVLTQDRGAADLVLPSKLGGMLASGRRVLVMADPGTELHDLLYETAIIVPTGDVHALKAAIKSASTQRLNPPPQTAKVLELFSSKTILPAFRRAIRGISFYSVERKRR